MLDNEEDTLGPDFAHPGALVILLSILCFPFVAIIWGITEACKKIEYHYRLRVFRKRTGYDPGVTEDLMLRLALSEKYQV